MNLCVPKKMGVESEKKVSSVLIVADASSQALELVLNSLQTLR